MRGTIAIVGANLAGGRAALALRTEGFEGEIHLIGAEPHPPYERPPLSKAVLLEDYKPEQTYLLSESEWEEHRVLLRLSTVVTSIQPATRELEFLNGDRLRADKVLLCTGGHLRRLEVPGAELTGVEYLRTIGDAVAVRDKLALGLPVVIVGGGFVGAEVAACANQVGCDVTLLEIEDVPLWRVLGRELGAILTRFHIDNGVRVATKTSVDRFEGSNGAVTHVVTSTGEWIEAGLVVVGIGINPATELADGAGIQTTNGILVNEFCETSNPGVFAAGDVANHPNLILGERIRLEHWQNAQNQAASAARSMLGQRKEFREVPWFWSDQYDLNVQMSGHPHAEDHVLIRGDSSSNSFSAFFLRGSVLKAVLAVNRPRDVHATMKLIESCQLLDEAQIADESIDLRTLFESGRSHASNTLPTSR